MNSLQCCVLVGGQVEPDGAAAHADAVLMHGDDLAGELGSAAAGQLHDLGGVGEAQRAAQAGAAVGLKEGDVPAAAQHEVHQYAAAGTCGLTGVADTLSGPRWRVEHPAAAAADLAGQPPPGCGCPLAAHGESLGETEAKISAGDRTIVYDWSGGMESSAMLVVDRERIRDTQAIVRWADTGKHLPEMYASKLQIESILGLQIVTVPRRITFDQFLFERGGMVRKGTNDCSRRMKRSNLSRHLRTLPAPYEVNLGFNAGEVERASDFVDRNEREWCGWRFPLIEAQISRAATWDVCRRAGFTVLVGVYEKMGRFDCYFCGNQTASQALRVADHYPELAAQWMEAEERKGHSFLPSPLKIMVEQRDRGGKQMTFADTGCACFGGTEDVWDDEVMA